METANELANKHKLSRQTMSVQRDPKRNTVVVVEQISCSGMEYPRSETYYKMYDDVPTEKMNELLAHAKNDATLQFLGLPLGTVEVKLTETVEVVEATVEVQIEKPKTSIVRKRRVTKKPATKADAAPEVSIVQQVAAQAVAEAGKIAAEVVGAAEDKPQVYEAPENVKSEVNNITYSKASREHINLLRPLIQKAFGADWKKDDEKRVAVREIVSKLNGKVAVTDPQGVPLASFEVVAQEIIDSVKDLDL